MIATLRYPLEQFPATATRERLWVFYDGVCGACSTATSWALSFDRDRRLRAVPVQSLDAQGRLGELAEGEALAELHVWSAERAYRWFASRRMLFGAASCEVRR